MSTQNTVAVAPATEDQKTHILTVMWKKRLEDRSLTLDEAQAIITGGNLYVPIMDQAADLLVDKVRSDRANTLVRMVRNIRRSRNAVEAIDATGRAKYVDGKIVATMPVGQGPEEVELTYFRIGEYATAAQVMAEYESRGLEPDPQAQCADNEADPAFADEHPNGTQWNVDKNVSSCVAFRRGGGGRGVGCDRYGIGWDGLWWFAGLRKVSK